MTDVSAPAFTPGPWLVTEPNDPAERIEIVGGGDGKSRATARQIVALLGHQEERTLPNAHLIAAAPDLYEALDAFRDRVGKSRDVEDTMRIITDWCPMMHAALAKARGELLTPPR